jgi:hypothetical protein
MKTIYAYGIDQLWIPGLRESYEVVIQREKPSPEIVKDQVLILTSDQLPADRLHELRHEYPDAIILYQLKEQGVRGYVHVHAAAEAKGIHFLSPRATINTLLDKLAVIFNSGIEATARTVGFFGSSIGVGVTSLAATFASSMADKGKNVILLGLDFYNPGWYGSPKVSLDSWQPRLTGKVLQLIDFNDLIVHKGFRYLPGNYDILSIQQYREDEIEFLIEQACAAADVVVLDCGSIPESAGWYVGMQKSTIRYFVTHPGHHYLIQPIMDVLRHLDISPQDFQMIINRSNMEGGFLTSSDLKQEYNMLHSEIEIPMLNPVMDEIVLPLGKKETQAIGQAADGILKAFGFETAGSKKGGLFR